jgi:phosphate-selective porin OprO/OprP
MSQAKWVTSARKWVALSALAALFFTSSLVRAQTPTDETKTRVGQLETEVQELKAMLKRLGTQPTNTSTASPVPAAGQPNTEEINKIVDQKLEKVAEEAKRKEAEKEAEKKATEDAKAEQGFVVGADRKLNASWDEGGFRYKTADEAFNVHLGGRLMTDEAWFKQSPNLRQTATQPAGSPLANITGVGPGIGDLQDGFFTRRVRLVADGQIYEVMEFKVEADFENYNNISFDESYVGFKNLPFIDTVRIGQSHVPFGLEAYTSSRFLPMLERSPVFDAFYQEFAPGIFTNTTFLDQRVTTQHMFHRIDNFNQFNGASFGDGQYAYSGRISGLPVYEDDGRTLLHLGLAYQWRKGSNPADFNAGTVLASTPTATTNTDIIRFRARPSIRDAVGLQGDGARVIDTGNIIADDVQSVNGEFLLYWNSLWVQAEACLAHVDNAFFPATNRATNRSDLNYYGTYVQVGYFLTGETRGYDKRFGKYGRVVPLENFFLVRDENGQLTHGLGAWEIMYRYSLVNLNDETVQGGRYGEHTVGLNWYLNSNIKFQLNYINGQRDVPAGAASGNVQAVALRGALEF